MSDQNSDPSRPFDPPVPPTTPPTAPPAAPEAPPAPPEPPSPERPPVPQYGEYAPAGYVAPNVAAANPYGIPGYSAPAAVPVPVSAGAPAYQPPVRKRRTWDTVLTVILLVLALFGTIFGLVYAGLFANPALLEQQFADQGYSGLTLHPGAAPVILVVSHLVLFILAAGLSIPLLSRGKIVVFWIPLVVGFVAAIIFWSTVISVVLSDPGFISQYGG